MTTSTTLACCVVGLDVVAYALYNWKMITGTVSPYRGTTAVWTFIAIMGAASYQVVSNDIVKSALSIENAFSCSITLIFALIKGDKRPLKPVELKAIAIGFAAGLVWWYFREARYGSFITQFATAIACHEIISDLRQNPKGQSRYPWFLWSIIYYTLTIIVLMRWDGRWETLIYPINYFVLHAYIFRLTLRRPKH